MIRVKLERLTDGRIVVTVTIGKTVLLNRWVHVTDSAPVVLEVPDE